MTIKLIEAIAQKAVDDDGLSAADKQGIATRFGIKPEMRAKVEEALKIFDDLVVETDERRRLITLLGLDKAAQRSLDLIIGNDGRELFRKRKWHLRVSEVINKLEDRDSNVRKETTATLAVIKEVRAVPKLIDLLNNDANHNVRAWAASALGDIGDKSAVPALTSIAKDTTLTLKDDWLRRVHRRGLRVIAVRALAKIGDGRAVPTLIALLEDDERDVQLAAAHALGKIGDQRALPHLCARLEAIIREGVSGHIDLYDRLVVSISNFKDARAVTALLGALHKFEKEENYYKQFQAWFVYMGAIAVPPLIKALEGEYASDAAELLPKIKDGRIVPSLVAVLKDKDVGSSTLRLAASILGKIKDARAVPALITVLRDRKNGSLRWDAADALGAIKDARAVPALMRIVRERGFGNAAMKALGTIGDRRAMPAIFAALKHASIDAWFSSDFSWDVAIEALYKIKDVPALIAALEDEHLKDYAAFLLHRIGDGRAVLPLLRYHARNTLYQPTYCDMPEFNNPHAFIGALTDGNYEVRTRAAQELGRIKDNRAVPVLIAALKDVHAWVRASAASALGKIGDTRAIPEIIRTLQDDDAHVRRCAAWALGEFKDNKPDVVLWLTPLLRDPVIEVRRAAARTLGKLSPYSATSALVELLLRSDEDDRLEAIEAIYDRLAVPMLITALKDRNKEVRVRAAWALGRIEGDHAVPALISALEDGNWHVRAEAATSLGLIGNARAVPALIAQLKDNDEHVRKATTEALRSLKTSAVAALKVEGY